MWRLHLQLLYAVCSGLRGVARVPPGLLRHGSVLCRVYAAILRHRHLRRTAEPRLETRLRLHARLERRLQQRLLLLLLRLRHVSWHGGVHGSMGRRRSWRRPRSAARGSHAMLRWWCSRRWRRAGMWNRMCRCRSMLSILLTRSVVSWCSPWRLLRLRVHLGCLMRTWSAGILRMRRLHAVVLGLFKRRCSKCRV